jgi:serine/threonine protein kinase
MAHAAKHHLQSNTVGAINYMAQEQLHGSVSEKSDQYALACIAYELCTGHLPYKEPPFSTTQGRPKPPLAPRLLNHKLSAHAELAILRALSIRPDQRYDNVTAFVTALGHHDFSHR